MTAQVLSEIADGVMTICFNRPDKRNALNTEMYRLAADAVRAAQSDRNVRVIVITGAGEAFTAGNDLKDFIENPPSTPDAPVFKFMGAMCDLTKPVIAAVNGLAIGIGVTILLHCDFAYAVPGARFQLPFVNLALVPEFASSLLLKELIGARPATELMMLGEPFTAEKALEYGLVNDLIPTKQLMNTVQSKARAIAHKPPGAIRDTKTLIRADRSAVRAKMNEEIEFFAKRLDTPEAKEAVQAFFEKRNPDFSKFD
jgi:enoyl-CoA hydratase/carnithine racemase